MKLALTGGVAEGKSTVASYLREAGFNVISADEVAREVFRDPAVQRQIAELLHIEVPVEPTQVREGVFQAVSLRRSINRLMHPRILAKLLDSNAPVVEVPLLFETCIHPYFQRIWVVTCGPEQQLKRLASRLGNEEAARSMIQAQLPARVKSAFADRIIRTNFPADTVRSYVFASIGRDLQAHLAHE